VFLILKTVLLWFAGYIATPMLAEGILGDANKPQEGACFRRCCPQEMLLLPREMP